MRLAILSFEFPPATAFGGIATYSAQLADMMVHAGHDVEVFAGGPAVPAYHRPSGALVHQVGCTDATRFLVPATVAFCARAAAQPFDVIEAPEYLAPAFHIAALAPDTALVLRLHTPTALIARINLPPARWRQPWMMIARQLKAAWYASRHALPLPSIHLAHDNLRQAAELDEQESTVARSADLLCSPSIALQSYPATHWRITDPPTIHLPNIYEAPRAILELPIAREPKCIGFFGRLEIRKGILIFADAIHAIARDFPQTRLLFVGQSTPLDGVHADAQQHLAKICADAGLTAEFAGRQPPERLAYWYGQCDIVMLPSRWENFPYVCLEAMAAGRAVIGSSAGGMADMITPGETGFLGDPAEPATFAKLALRLLGSSALCEKLGTAARASVLARYSPTVLVGQYEMSYRGAIAHRRATGPRSCAWRPAIAPTTEPATTPVALL